MPPNVEIWAAKFLSQNYTYAAKGEQTGLERNSAATAWLNSL